MNIITIKTKLNIGQVYTYKDIQLPFEDRGKFYYDYTLVPLRESTKEEYEQWIINEYGPNDYLFFNYFYEISMD